MKPSPNRTPTWLLSFLGVLVLVICILSAFWLAGIFYLSQRAQITSTQPPGALKPLTGNLQPSTNSPSPLPQLIPTQPPGAITSTPATLQRATKPQASPLNPQLLTLNGAQETVKTIEDTSVPINDLSALATRLRSRRYQSATTTPTTTSPQVGDKQSFWAMDTDDNRKFQVLATLVYANDQTYFWVEDGVAYRESDVERLADTFDQHIVPTNRQFFGSEWSPGIDNDPRLHILYAKGLGNSIAGYFSSADEYPVEINEFSNQREMFFLNADTTRLTADYTYGSLAHEFQHMIHWYQDRNEETWLNEGFSDLAYLLNGYIVGGADDIFVSEPDIQLNDWPAEVDPAHYGAAFLFVTYFLDRFGEKATQAVVSNSANGLTSFDQVLAGIGAQDPLTGKPVGSDDLFIDWTIANYLQDRRVSDGRYAYHIYPTAPKASATETIRNCPTGIEKRTVHQYGADYIHIRCPGDYLIRFEGPSEVDLLPSEPHSGSYSFWSNRGDESDMTLTRLFDFRDVSGPLSLNYWTWYDIEEGFDQVYLLASVDDGTSWKILKAPSSSLKDLSGNGFGWAYTGQSGGDQQPHWIQEQIDISSLAGKEVLLRFEYVTDAAVNGEGFLLDDLSIPQIGYSTDFEADAGGWLPQGFARVQNVLPQNFRLGLIEKGKNTRVSVYGLDGIDQTQQPSTVEGVEALIGNTGQSLEIPIHIGEGTDEVILVVSGTTRITRQPAEYSYQIKH